MARSILKVLLVGGIHALLMSESRAEVSQCFGILGDKFPDFVKCQDSSACCRTQDACQPNRLCRYDYPGDPKGIFYRGPCASTSGWQVDTCAPICLYSGPGTNTAAMPQYEPLVTQCEDGTFCCDNDPTCCENDRGKILSVLDGGRVTLLQPTKVSRNAIPVPSAVKTDGVVVGVEISSTSISFDGDPKELKLRAETTVPSNWTWTTPSSTLKTSTVFVVTSLSALSDSMSLSSTPGPWEPPNIQTVTTLQQLANPSLPSTPTPPTPPTQQPPPTPPTAPTPPTPPPIPSALASSVRWTLMMQKILGDLLTEPPQAPVSVPVSEKSSLLSDLQAPISIKETPSSDPNPHNSVQSPQPTTTRTPPPLLPGQTNFPPITTTQTVPTNHYSFPTTTNGSTTTLTPVAVKPSRSIKTLPSLQPNGSLSDQQQVNQGLTTGAKAALGVLLPLFSLLIAGFFLWRWKLRRQEEQLHFSLMQERNAKRDTVVNFLSNFSISGREGRNSLVNEEGGKRGGGLE